MKNVKIQLQTDTGEVTVLENIQLEEYEGAQDYIISLVPSYPGIKYAEIYRYPLRDGIGPMLSYNIADII